MCIANLTGEMDSSYCTEFDIRRQQMSEGQRAADRAFMSFTGPKALLLDELYNELIEMQNSGYRNGEFTATEKKLMEKYQELQR